VVTPGGPCGELGGFFDHGMPRSLVEAPLPMRDGVVCLPGSPGLGVAVNWEAVSEFEEDHREWRR